MSHLEVQKALFSIFVVRRETLACPTCAEVGSLMGVEPSPTSAAAVLCSSCSAPTTMEELQVRLPEGKTETRENTSLPTTDNTSEVIAVLRAELKTLQEALAQMTAMYELLMAQVIGDRGKKGNISFPLPAPTKLPSQTLPRKQQTPRKPASATPLHKFTFQAPTLVPTSVSVTNPPSATWAERTKVHLPARKKPSTARSIAADVRVFKEDNGPMSTSTSRATVG
ncbi:hypothetical protein INT43_001784 [Umbelopsis isabellina]|uniref:Uncharacterized protein n=1 Tax=Mortierella isabellina TaxID=91625 RepID=A0A8H7PRH9_MORIS|nr:hypothetical protein INT43_001784 [Umbelopsis isabellina]